MAIKLGRQIPIARRGLAQRGTSECPMRRTGIIISGTTSEVPDNLQGSRNGDDNA
jgi:hypothetical protein